MNKKSFSEDYIPTKLRYERFLRTMKIVSILLFSSIFCLFAENTHSQSALVSINRKDIQLEKVLEEIETQTNYLFVYNKQVNIDRTVSIRETDTPLEKVLEGLFKGTDINYAVEGSYIILSMNSNNSVLGVSQQTRVMIVRIRERRGDFVFGGTRRWIRPIVEFLQSIRYGTRARVRSI